MLSKSLLNKYLVNMRIKGNKGQCQWLHIINRAKVTTVNFSLQTALKVTGNVLNSSFLLMQKKFRR